MPTLKFCKNVFSVFKKGILLDIFCIEHFIDTVYFFKEGPLCVAQAALELTRYPSKASALQVLRLHT